MTILRINKPLTQQAGVTLVELVVVIVLMGIVGIGLINVIRNSVEAYREVTRRDEISQIGRFAIERVSRELRGALPGSIRENGTCIEFVPVLAASFYKQSTLPVGTTADDFVAVAFALPVQTPTRASVYALVPGDVYSESHMREIDWPPSTFAGESTVTFSSTGQSFPEHSPGRRVYFVDEPISFCVVGTELRRYAGYGYNTTAVLPPTSGEVLLAEFIQTTDGATTVTPFDFSAATGLQRNGIVHLDFRFQARDSANEWVRFSHDIAIRGEP